MSNQAVLRCQGVSKVYHEAGQALQILEQVDLQVLPGQRIAIIGSSGSGKSTLLNILGGLEAPSQGQVWVAGQPLYQVSEQQRSRLRNRQLGFVYQFHHLLGEFTALENVALPLLLAGQTIRTARAQAQQMLQQVGLAQRLLHKPAQLSGGERQRVAIARALVTQPACVLMDEPTGNLDQHTADDIQQLMTHLNQQLQLSFIVVTHDIALARQMDNVLELKDGQLTASPY